MKKTLRSTARTSVQVLTLVIGAMLASTAWGPARADAPAADAATLTPEVEKVLARHEGFELEVAIKAVDGTRFRQGTYDVSVVVRGDEVFIQMIHTATRRGVRLPANLKGSAQSRMATSDETKMLVRSVSDRTIFRFEATSFVAESILANG